jgi:pSer/pThr/pTyr-binding forkhead associated (FHA) protein
MIKLLVKFGDESREVEIKETEISIGRSADNVLPLADKKSSRKHAKIEKVGDEYRINDLGSGNGTKVNGKDVNTQALAKGDEIAIGLTTMFVLSMDTPAKPAASPAPASSPAAPAVASPASAGGSPATPRTEMRSPESMAEARRKITRRGTYGKRSSNWVGTMASLAVLAAIAGVGIHFYMKQAGVGREARRQGRPRARERGQGSRSGGRIHQVQGPDGRRPRRGLAHRRGDGPGPDPRSHVSRV